MLSDKDILRELDNRSLFIENFDRTCIRSSSYLARLDAEILCLRDGDELIDTKSIDTESMFDRHYVDEGGFILEPNKFYLLSSFEKISLPNFISADISLLSCYARIGLIGNLCSTHVTATFGFGKPSALTFELLNQTSRKIKIYPKVKFFHLRFFYLSSACNDNYQGIYSGYSGPKPSNFSRKPAQ
jgi:deoxycytidine triphosphate deaminase